MKILKESTRDVKLNGDREVLNNSMNHFTITIFNNDNVKT